MSPISIFRWQTLLVAILAAGFAARVGVRVAFGAEYFWKNSYLYLYAMAERLASGKGFCIGSSCPRPPMYLSFLALTTFGGKNYLLIIVPQALLGIGTAYLAFLIGRDIFDKATGLLACAIVAFYPYYVMHDSALQDTAMATFCVSLSVWLLLRARQKNKSRDWLLAGLALGALPLVRASTAPIIVVALLWTAVWGVPGTIKKRLRPTIILVLAIAVVLSPWLALTYRNTGAAVLSTDTGYALWVSNNPETFSQYPAKSIDRSRDRAWSKLTQDDLAQLRSLSGNQAATSNWFTQRALDYILANPQSFIQGMFRKLAAAFSWRLNPHREPLAQAIYAIGYVPIAALGIIGMVLARRRPETALIAMLFLAFMAVTAVFIAHTSHRTFLDVYWIVFAASVLVRYRKFLMHDPPHEAAAAHLRPPTDLQAP